MLPLIPLAYHHVGSWLAYTVARGLIYRVIWRATAGLHLPALLLLAAAAVLVVVIINRRLS